MAADAQRDLTRVPMHFTRLSDEQEITIGRNLAANYSGIFGKLTPEEEALQNMSAASEAQSPLTRTAISTTTFTSFPITT